MPSGTRIIVIHVESHVAKTMADHPFDTKGGVDTDDLVAGDLLRTWATVHTRAYTSQATQINGEAVAKKKGERVGCRPEDAGNQGESHGRQGNLDLALFRKFA